MTLPINPDYDLACELIDGDDIEFWRPQVEHICQLHGISFDNMHKINGWANGIFDLDGQYILKVVPPNWASQGSRELDSLSLLAGHTLPVAIPKLIADGEINGWLYVLMNKLPGTNLHEIWMDLPEENQCLIVKQVAEFANQLHALPMPEESALSLDWPTFLKEQKENCVEKRKKQGLTGPLLDDILNFVEQVDYQPVINRPCLVHTDLHPGNLLAEKVDGQWHLSGVIDFGDAFIGNDRYFEFATSAILMGLGNKAVNQALLEGYQLEIEDKKQFAQHLMALSLLRHTGEMAYVLQQVPGCDELSDWQSVAERFFAL